jgi:hypothetical protein
MQFINPIEILNLSKFADSKSIDNDVIKKNKRKLFAEIDLSDEGNIYYKGVSLTKAECESVITKLENQTYKEFYWYLAIDNRSLNDFLVNGDDDIFKNLRQDSIYKYSDFVNFVSPYFAVNFDKSLVKSFLENNELKTRNLLKAQQLIGTADINTAYRSLSIEIQNRISTIDMITNSIKSGESDFSDKNIEDVVKTVQYLFPINLLNLLPSYFQSQINKAAASINFLQLAIWNEFNVTSVPLKLLEYLLMLNIESASKPTFQKNLDIVKKADNKRNQQEKIQLQIGKLFTLLKTFEGCVKSISNAQKLIFDAKPYLFNIKSLLGNDDTYISLSTRVASMAQDFIIEEINRSQSNNKNDILFSIRFTSSLKKAWEATKLIGSLEMQPDFIVNRFNPNQETLKAICGKFSIPTPSFVLGKIPKSNFIINDGTITHTDKNSKPLPVTTPFIRGDVRYIGINLKIEVLEHQSLKFNLKYIQPNGTVKTGTSSPSGFTLSYGIVISTYTTNINFSGWGNSEQGTYEVGTHYIEVWLDNCMIYRKPFEIDWSEAEKLENARKAEEKREQQKIETAKREERNRIEALKAKEKKVRKICMWIMGLFVGIAVVFTIWGTEGLTVLGGIGIFLIIGSVIAWLKSL